MAAAPGKPCCRRSPTPPRRASTRATLRTSGPYSGKSPLFSEATMNGTSGPKLTAAGKIFVFLFVAACLYGAYLLFLRRPVDPGRTQKPSLSSPETSSDQSPVEIGIAYG